MQSPEFKPQYCQKEREKSQAEKRDLDMKLGKSEQRSKKNNGTS
jgi:hypothetical protein